MRSTVEPRGSSSVADEPTVTDMMVAYAQDAVEHAQTSSGIVVHVAINAGGSEMIRTCGPT
jgi:hypothetical protein